MAEKPSNQAISPARPPSASGSVPHDVSKYVDLYRHMLLCRKLDELEESLAHRGEVPFYIPAAGHEAMAALALHLGPQDWLHLHYRDKALALARGVTPELFLYSLLGKVESNSSGRRMPGFVSSRALQILSSPTVVGNNSVQALGVAAAVRDREGSPIVYCGMGDGSTQQGEVYEAFCEAARSSLPVLFIVEDNHFALSTETAGKMFYSIDPQNNRSFCGIPIEYVDGTNAIAVYNCFGHAVARMRKSRKPLIIVATMERLRSHTNSDDQAMYRSAEEIARIQAQADPVTDLRKQLLSMHVAESTLAGIETAADKQVHQALITARTGTEPSGVGAASKPFSADFLARKEYLGTGAKDLTMLEAMREVFRLHLASPDVTMFGEDIEDPKGDVFGLTRSLSTQFPQQVMNSPLAEGTILGMSIGRALVGEKPVAMLQFADFMPPAFNQISAELAPMYWRTNGDWNAPVLITAICGAYRAGLGPYHAQTPAATLGHLPGLDVVIPSTAADAAGLLNASFASGRPTVFLYPKTLINDRGLATSKDVKEHFVPIGKARTLRSGSDLTLVSFGSTVPLCDKAAEILETAGWKVELIDLRSISPWDREAVIASAKKTGRLLVVHEDQKSFGIGSEVLATVAESAGDAVRMGRVAQADALIPFHFPTHLETLPTLRTILEKAADLLELDLGWEQTASSEGGFVTVNAIGSSPSDETIKITKLHVKQGARIDEGQLIASVEADKATMEIAAPVAGMLEELLLKEGDSVRVGTPLARIRSEQQISVRRSAYDLPGRPAFNRRRTALSSTPAIVHTAVSTATKPVVLSGICSALGKRVLTNDDLAKVCSGWTSQDVIQRTGIEKRHWIAEGESALTLGVEACRKLLDQEKTPITEIDAIICSTGTPPSTTPSLACRILKELTPPGTELLMQAHDINAACSGYLYALQQAHDLLRYNPEMKILLVTSETLSPVLDKQDPTTYFLFGDAATATLLSCDQDGGTLSVEVRRPVLSGLGSDEKTLYVPSIQSTEFVQMDGLPVFRIATKKMIDMLNRACKQEGLTLDDLAMIVPHQANERIMEAVRKAIKFPTEKVFYFIRDYGNTSSNTIPLSLQAIIPKLKSGDTIGLTAFGGGFTFAAGILKVQ